MNTHYLLEFTNGKDIKDPKYQRWIHPAKFRARESDEVNQIISDTFKNPEITSVTMIKVEETEVGMFLNSKAPPTPTPYKVADNKIKELEFKIGKLTERVEDLYEFLKWKQDKEAKS